jgi:peroxiredoxin-like protein
MSITQPSVTVKQPQPIAFDTRLNWLGNKKGALMAGEVMNSIYVATPKSFGGEGHDWSPEHLFLGALSSCFMTTFLAFAKKSELPFFNFTCDAKGTINLVNGKYRFTEIELLTKVYIIEEGLKEQARQVMEKAQQYCMIGAAINCPINYQHQVRVGFQSQLMADKTY